MNTDYLIHLVKTYFSTVFFLWVLGNILLRLIVTKKKRTKKKKKGKKGGGVIGDILYEIFCFIMQVITMGGYTECDIFKRHAKISKANPTPLPWI